MKLFITSQADKQRVCRTIESLTVGNWTVMIEETKRVRSAQQNARYWAILGQIADQMALRMDKGYDTTTWHEWFKAKFLGRDMIEVDGLAHHVARRSSKLKVGEFLDYCTQVEVWAAENGVMIE